MTGAAKNIIIGISGGIAAYKSLLLIRLFKRAGWNVRVVATKNALQFVTKLSIETLSQQPLYGDTFAENAVVDVHHVSWAEWADVVVVAPATANIIGKMAHGIADDALSTLLLAVKKPLFVAPAMNSNMFENAAVQQNLAILRARGCHILSPNSGFLACGSEGNGRMAEPDDIFRTIIDFCEAPKPLAGRRVLVTAGPTHEPIDPVRFIGNRSSGLMGFAIAEAFAQRGAAVTLVTGSTVLKTAHPNIQRIDIETAAEMANETLSRFPEMDIVVMAAAVADYTPKISATEKIKKHDDTLTIELVKTTDILREMGNRKTAEQVLVGFALETNDEICNAQQKLQNKNLDFIVLNSMKDAGAGFNVPTNRVTIMSKSGEQLRGMLKSKSEVAADIVDVVTASFLHN